MVTMTVFKIGPMDRRSVKLMLFVWTILLVFLSPGVSSAKEETITIKVVRVVHGDTLRGTDEDGKEFRVKLEGIEAPEAAQAFGYKARLYLRKLIEGKEVTVVFSEESDETIIGRVFLGKIDVGEKMMEDGCAWYNPLYCHKSFCQKYSLWQETAQAAKKGLWKGPKPVPPWEYRLNKDKYKDWSPLAY
ncbi:MAG: thermonuclease family protein [Deltaproteobacteria bacterium]|nr:thermonuclease family protein [Deltaproteobacteria bacterium]